jgi:acetyltransferase-like isoleucine patch superfamily enzyme
MMQRISQRLATWLGVWLEGAQAHIARRSLPRFARQGSGLVVALPREIHNPHLIELGTNVKLGANSVLRAATAYPGPWLAHPEGAHVEQTFQPRLRIGDRVTATAALHVEAFSDVTIEDDVMLARNIFIADGTHSMRDGTVPYKYQGIDKVAPVRIGRGAWIGSNVVVMPGVTIGACAVVGANSVVTGDVPPHAVAVGSPARVVQIWDGEAGAWRRLTASADEAPRAAADTLEEEP